MTSRQEQIPSPEDLARADRIRGLLKHRGWPVIRAADAVGVSQSTFETWIGKTKAVKPNWPHLAKLAEVFDVTPEWLETGNNDRGAQPADPVQTLRHDVDQLRGRVTQIDQQIRFIAENRDGITRLEAAAAEIRDLLREQMGVLADLLQEQVVEQTEALADRRVGEGHAPASGERRRSRGRRQTDP